MIPYYNGFTAAVLCLFVVNKAVPEGHALQLGVWQAIFVATGLGIVVAYATKKGYIATRQVAAYDVEEGKVQCCVSRRVALSLALFVGLLPCESGVYLCTAPDYNRSCCGFCTRV